MPDSSCDYPHEKRMELAAKGEAMPDGSYPTDTSECLQHAFEAYGRETDANRPALRRYLVRRAVAMGRTDLIPDDWHVEGTHGNPGPATQPASR
jgi:hypothetical protein